MFEGLVAKEANHSDAAAEFLALYAKFHQSLAYMRQQADAGVDIKAHKVRFYKIEVAMDNAWARLSEDLRHAVVESLIQRKMLPEHVRTIIQVFQAKVISLNG